ncbi:hypothetical protein PRZ48_014688 [Zasmidium cellare]|uniref:Uncharacterized protein n=1 Tax=Zasmidium cellare TaxID=395010 RepID=A0ABR0DZ23_ZASCE|nr:hypothetical protein PRZ48_014688 [Zasmidium cellare]
MSSNREQTETADDVTPFRFFNLSAELRNRIYEYTFSGVEAKLPVADPRGDYSDKFSAAPSLLLTCKQIYTEGLTIYFSESAFYSESSRRMREWLEFIGSILRRQVSFVGYGPAIREPNTTRLSQARLGDDARDLVKLRKLMLNVIRRSHVITVEEIPEEKLHVRFVFPLLPGIATHWTNNPKDAATKFGERLAEIRKCHLTVALSRSWWAMLYSFGMGEHEPEYVDIFGYDD